MDHDIVDRYPEVGADRDSAAVDTWLDLTGEACSQRQFACTSATVSRTGSALGSTPNSRISIMTGRVAVHGCPAEK